MRVKYLAHEALGYFFQYPAEPSHNRGKITKLSDAAPVWVKELVREAHLVGISELLPDDWTYGFIVDILTEFTETEDLDSDSLPNLVDWIIDPYVGDLVKWLTSNLNRIAYVDEAMDEVIRLDSLSHALELGQRREIEELAHFLYSHLKMLCEIPQEE